MNVFEREKIDDVVKFGVEAQTIMHAARGFFAKLDDAEKVRMFKSPKGLRNFVDLFDRAFRPSNNDAKFKEFARLLKENGVPDFLLKSEVFLFKMFRLFGEISPTVSVPILVNILIAKTAKFMHLGDNPAKSYGRTDDVSYNVNRLGEMILGEIEKLAKRESDLESLADPKVDCLSVKPSNLYSQINPMAFRDSVDEVKSELRYRIDAAKKNPPTSGYSRKYKLLCIDMEDYSDLDITHQAFKEVLLEPEYIDYQMSIAVQAYMPDAFKKSQELLDFAHERVAKGGAPIRVRLVKGANIPAEIVKASENGWKTPTFKEKIDTDAMWKKCLELFVRPENVAVCELGIATHNTFDLYYAENLLRQRQIEQGVEFEVLQGMGDNLVNHIVDVLKRRALVYLPTISRDKFLTVLPYYIRRLQELAEKNNYLSHTFNFDPNSDEFKKIIEMFLASIEHVASVSVSPRNAQNRLSEMDNEDSNEICTDFTKFKNDPLTLFALPANREWLKIVRKIQESFKPKNYRNGHLVEDFDYEIDEDLIDGNPEIVIKIFDKTCNKRVIGNVEFMSRNEIDNAIFNASNGENVENWRNLDIEARLEVFTKAINLFKKYRAELIALSGLEISKQVDQADAEVSEIIDFINTYAVGMTKLLETPGLKVDPKGVVGCIGPFNFSMAIPAGGVVAALMGGNSVILKPSNMALLSTTRIAEILIEAGVPKDVLQVVHCADIDAPYLVSKLFDLIFTGSTETAQRIKAENPNLNLYAETGGKNVMYVSDTCDHEKAIKDIVASLKFNGQKCSATSLVCLERSLYQNTEFMRQLVDAVQSLKVGAATDDAATITPLIQKPNDKLAKGLNRKDNSEIVIGHKAKTLGKSDYAGWLLKPRKVDRRDDFWTPGIYIGTKKGDFAHKTEFFGPIIDVMSVDNLDEAIDIAKTTGYGLTMGIQSLNNAEINKFLNEAQAGVLYVNNKMVGAEAGRNPFGGWLDSSFGPGIQAGGPNYVLNFVKVSTPVLSELNVGLVLPDKKFRNYAKFVDCICDSPLSLLDKQRIQLAFRSMVQEVDNFLKPNEAPDKVVGKIIAHKNVPVGSVLIVEEEVTNFADLVIQILAARMTNDKVHVVVSPNFKRFAPELFLLLWRAASNLGIRIDCANLEDLGMIVSEGNYDLVRSATPNEMTKFLKKQFLRSKVNCHIEEAEVVMYGPIEMKRNVKEQSIVYSYHRYGDNLNASDYEKIKEM